MRDRANDSTLSDRQQTLLSQLLDRYLASLEQGERLDPAELKSDHPELAGIIDPYLCEIDLLFGLVDHRDEIPCDSNSAGLSPGGTFSLGGYTIIREIGRGGMGAVYEAHEAALNRRVAVKILSVAATLDQRQITRFKNESHAAGQLRHPNIVPIFSIGCENHFHYYVMQLIEGTSIDRWIQQQREDSSESQRWQLTVEWAIAIADALHCAHQCGIVHRDVKPSNLLLDHHGKIWITDFGLARCQQDLAITRTGEIVGTMRYMSPEQASAGMVDHRTDIYSLASSLFEMLTLRPAILGNDGAGVVRRIADDEPPQLRRFRSDLPVDLSVVLRKAMSNRKDDRYDSAQQFAEDLRSVLDCRPTIARPPSLASLSGRWALKHRKSISVAAFVALLAMIGLVVSTGIISEKSREVQHQETRADHYFARAHRTVNQFGTNIAEQLTAVPGTEPIRRRVLQDALEYYQQFVAEAVGDATLQSEIATTHSRIADLVKQLDGPDKAIPHYRRAAEIFSALPADDARGASTQRQIAENLNNLGIALAGTGDMNGALSAYRQADTVQARLLAEHPDEDKFAVDLAVTHNNLGLLLFQAGDIDEARAWFEKAIVRLRPLAGAHDASVLAERTLAAALTNLSSTRLEDDPGEASLLLKHAIELLLDASDRAPNRLISSVEIATLYNDLGSVYMRLDRTDEAERAFSHAIRIRRQLAGIAPLVGDHRRNLAISLNNSAMSKQKQARQADAAADFREAIELMNRTLDRPSGNPNDYVRLGATEHNLALLLAQQNQNRESDALLKSAIEHQETALALAPKSVEAASYLRRHYAALLQSQTRRGLRADVRATRAAIQRSAIAGRVDNRQSDKTDANVPHQHTSQSMAL